MSAIDAFRRAMRRHEKRARVHVRWKALGDTFAAARRRPQIGLDNEGHYRRTASEQRRRAEVLAYGAARDQARRAAFLYSLAADAVARLREATTP